MKNKLLNSFFILSLILTMSSFAYASEITGNLSSGGDVSSDATTGSLEGTVVSEESSGGGSSGGSSSGSRPRGAVLGASTSNPETDYSNAGALYPTRTIVAVTPTPTPIITEVPIEEVAVAPTDVFTNPVTEAATDSSGWSFMDWFFMGFIFLLFVLLVMYVINQSKNKERMQ